MNSLIDELLMRICNLERKIEELMMVSTNNKIDHINLNEKVNNHSNDITKIIIEFIRRELGLMEKNSSEFSKFIVIGNSILRVGSLYVSLSDNNIEKLYMDRDKVETDLFLAMFKKFKIFDDYESAKLFLELGGKE